MAKLNCAGLVAAFLLTTSIASAVQRDVASMRIELNDDGWILVPTMADGSVESFVGLRTGIVVGENITTIWFRRTASLGWESWAWSEQDHSKAIASIKSILGLPDSSDSAWPVVPSTQPAENPELLERGVLESDVFGAIVNDMSDPAPFVLALESSGWRAAWIDALLVAEDCDGIVILTAMADGVELQMNQGNDGEAAAYDQLQLACSGICLRWTWYGAPTPWTPWACGIWGPAAIPGPIPNGPCREICHYERTATRSQTRTATRRHWDCTRTTWTQTRTQTGTQTGRCDIYLDEVGCVPGALPCPAQPCNESSANCAPTTGVTTSGWTPSSPP